RTRGATSMWWRCGRSDRRVSWPAWRPASPGCSSAAAASGSSRGPCPARARPSLRRGRSNYALREVGQGLPDVLSDAGDEGDLLLRVPAGRRLAERPDALNDAGQVVCLEGQDPLPVVDAKRARGVGQDVGKPTTPLAVLPEQCLALPGREQVPLRGPDERIDVQEPLRRLPPGEGGRVVRGE